MTFAPPPLAAPGRSIAPRHQGPAGPLPLGTLARLSREILRAGPLRLLLVLLAIIASALAGVAGAVFTERLIDDYITPMLAEAQPDFGPLLAAVLVMAAIYAAGVVATFLYNWIVAALAQDVLRRLRDRMFAHLQGLPLRFFDRSSHGDVMSRFTNDTDTLRQLIAQALPQVINSVITVVAVFAAMLVLSWQLTIVMLVGAAAITWTGRFIAGKAGPHFRTQQRSLGALNGFIEETVNGQKVVKVFNHEARARERFEELNEEVFRAAAQANGLANILMPISAHLGNLLYVVIAVAGGALALGGAGGITIGVIAAFLQLSRSFTMPVSQLSQQLNAVVMALAGAERIFALLDEEPEDEGGTVTLREVDDDGARSWVWQLPEADGRVPVRGEVRLESVSFGYLPGEPVLHEVTLHAEPGWKVALVGSTGAGKTTIANLLNRFYDAEAGSITIDGIPIERIRRGDLRRSLGVVLQETSLFTGSVLENIRYGRLDASDEEVYRAARLAGADTFIRQLPAGYGTEITGGADTLSQGQRQLIAIARAAVADPPVLILDEATSSIDTRTEIIVQRGMDALMRGRTVFVIAHRLSTIRNADLILVLEHGRIIERGTHADLLALGGRYRELATGVAAN